MSIRPAAVSGSFYATDPAELQHTIRAMLADISLTKTPSFLHLKALIVPHAGYIYSGPIAASAYALLPHIAHKIRRVVLLGPTHRVAVHGLSLPGTKAFETPLGKIEIDADAAQHIVHLPQVTVNEQAHALEHSLEVQLPFLQMLLSDFKLLPLAVGQASPQEVAEVLTALWGGEETLIVISSDLSHYLTYDQARQVDQETVQAILHLNGPITLTQACGGIPINGLILAAHQHHLSPHLLDLRNSGDTAGDKNRVVGYASFAFTEKADPGYTLLTIARNAIASLFDLPRQSVMKADWLEAPGASFVTLTHNACLRGCIGSLTAHRALGEDVHHNALAAALHDPRFAPLTQAEYAQTQIEVSLLSPSQPLSFRNETHALAQLRPAIDGVIFEYQHYRSTFLPQVWAQLPTPRQFMAHLKRKAGLAEDFWSPDVKLSCYTVEKYTE